ncbi:MAG: 50S ribosomal protein L17 [Candidatus Marinimicrobia bacterium]|nr:50S ribosomal protein L17 [Candidatus Neomarinimicrobiota bacterium]
MRHQKRGRKLGRTASHRKAMLQNMAASVLLHKQIKTTEAKAKEARKLVERLITYGKKGTTHARRLAFAILRDKKATTILFDEIAPVYENRQGGYTRLIKLGYRPNDTSKVVLLQLVDFFSEEPKKDKKKSTEKKASKPAVSKKVEVKEEAPVEETVETVETEVVAEEVIKEAAPVEEAVEKKAKKTEEVTEEKK